MMIEDVLIVFSDLPPSIKRLSKRTVKNRGTRRLMPSWVKLSTNSEEIWSRNQWEQFCLENNMDHSWVMARVTKILETYDGEDFV